MARIHFRDKDQPSIKKTILPSRKWKRLFLVSLGFNILLGLTTLYMGYFT